MDYGTPGIQAIGQYLRSFSKQYRAACAKGNVAAVHELRVNARRLRNTFKTYSLLFSKKKLKRIDKLLQKAAAQVSALRDLDVLIQFLLSYKKKVRSKSGQTEVQHYISAMRKKRQVLLPSVTKGLNQFKSDLDLRRLTLAVKKQARQPHKFGRARLRRVFEKRIFRTVRELLEFHPVVRHPEKKAELHAMRIKAKHLRYTLENVGRYYDSRIKAYTQEALFFHKILGEIHDYDVWSSMIERDRSGQKSGPAMKQTLGLLQEYCQRMRAHAYRRFVQRWDKLNKNRFFEDLLELIYAHR